MRSVPFTLASRYRLDDESVWLLGIDPLRRYWIAVNGDSETTVALQGLSVNCFEEFQGAILAFRDLTPGDELEITGPTGAITIHCVTDNCYGLIDRIDGAEVWHLFDQETLESLLMTAHPDWRCAPRDLELGRKLIQGALSQTAEISKVNP